MQVKISARHGHLSEATQVKITTKVERLSRLFERLSFIEVTVDLEHEESPSVDVKVSAEHKHDFVAAEQSTNVMTAPWFDPDHYRSDSNQRWRHGCPHEELARGEFEWLQLLTHPEIWAFEGQTMRESMESLLDADRRARLEHMRHDRIDLS